MAEGGIKDETLEEVLARKYNMKEKLVAEGNFVALYGMDKEAVQLTATGISSKSFILATVSLSGEEKDYDLISITPLPLVELGIQSFTEKKMFVKCHFKPMQLYQLCSCEDQDFIWMCFVRVIDQLQRRRNQYGDQWRVVPFESAIPLSGVDMQSADIEHRSTVSSVADMYPWSRDSEPCTSLSSLSKSASDSSIIDARVTRISMSHSSSSLPERCTENFTLETQSAISSRFRRGYSTGSIDANFSGSSFRKKDKDFRIWERELNGFNNAESVECIDVTFATSSVFSDCDNSVVLELGTSSESDTSSLDEADIPGLDMMLDNSDSTNKCELELDSYLNKSNNFLSSQNRFTEVAQTESADDNSSVKSNCGFIRRVCRQWFCCRNKK